METTITATGGSWFNNTALVYEGVHHGELLLPSVLDSLLTNLIARLPHTDGAILQNLKGRDGANVIQANVAGAHKVAENELFYMDGELLLDDSVPFSVTITSPFEEFRGDGDIVHRVRVETKNISFLDVEFLKLGRAFPLRPLHVRLAVECFHPRHLFGMIGVMPTVRASLLVEASSTTLLFRLSIEGKKIGDPPFNEALWNGFSTSIKESIGFDVANDFRVALAQHYIPQKK